MGIFGQFPYSNFHDMNMDWVLRHMRELIDSWMEYNENWNTWQNDINAAFNDLKEYVNTYFDNLDVQDEINNKLDEMLASGEFANILAEYASPKIKYYITTDDFTALEGLEEDSLYNWDIYRFYELYDYLPLERTRIGYGSTVNGTEDADLPIFAYIYRPKTSHMNTLSAPKHCIFTSGIHGNEKSGAYALYHFMKMLCSDDFNIVNDKFGGCIVYVIPICNPWGWNACINNSTQQIEANYGRNNARGVDLNRNFPQGWSPSSESGSAASSELETQAIIDYITNSCQPNRCLLMFDFHTSFNASEYEYESDFWFQHQAMTSYDAEFAESLYNIIAPLEHDLHNVDMTNQYVNITAPCGQYNGQLYNFMASVSPSFNGVGLFEGGKRMAIAVGEFVYNDHRNVEVYIDMVVNTLVHIVDHKMAVGFSNRSVLPLGTTYASWGNSSANRVQGFLGNQLSGNYLVYVDNKEYRYNIMYNDWAGNIGWDTEPRIWTPATGNNQNLILAKVNDMRLSWFDLCANAGVHFVKLP